MYINISCKFRRIPDTQSHLEQMSTIYWDNPRTSLNEKFEHGYPHCNALLHHFFLKL